MGVEGCGPSTSSVDISKIKLSQVRIRDYGKALFSIDPDSLSQGLDSIADNYGIFLGNDFTDPAKLLQLKDFVIDPFNKKIERQCRKEYPDLDGIEKELTLSFRYYKYYFPEKKLPQVYTYVSGLLYEAPVQYLDSVLIIALDMYLGSDFEPYRQIGLPKYKTRRMTRDYIVPDCMKEMGYSLISPDMPQNTLLDQMVMHGKALYFLDLVCPDVPDSIKIGFTSAQLDWCRQNEKNIWAYLIENELLYSTDSFVIDKFIIDGPFTSGFPGEAPAMMGRYIGWQIIRSYMHNNTRKDIHDLIAEYDAQQLLKDSKFKPRK